MTIEEAKELLDLCPICIGNHEGCDCRRHNAYVWVFERLEKLSEKLDPCDECQGYGDDYSLVDGELVSNCESCPNRGDVDGE